MAAKNDDTTVLASNRRARHDYTILDVHLRGGRVKVDLALAKGRKKEDRRAAIAEKESKIEMRRALGRQRRGKPE